MTINATNSVIPSYRPTSLNPPLVPEDNFDNHAFYDHSSNNSDSLTEEQSFSYRLLDNDPNSSRLKAKILQQFKSAETPPSAYTLQSSETASHLKDVVANNLQNRRIIDTSKQGVVHDIQQALVYLGSAEPSSQGQAFVDGFWGPNTKEAVKAFQGAHGLRQDGLVGIKTLQAMDSAIKEKSHANLKPFIFSQEVVDHAADVIANKGLFDIGNTGNVSELQRTLSHLGYLNEADVNGEWNDTTKNAVEAFQKTNGLDVEGDKIGINTLTAFSQAIDEKNYLTHALQIRNQLADKPEGRTADQNGIFSTLDQIINGREGLFADMSLEQSADALKQMRESAGNQPNSIPEGAAANHIFNNPGNDLVDTPENRTLLEKTANNLGVLVGIDDDGNAWSAGLQADGSMIWTQAKDGVILNAGIYNQQQSVQPMDLTDLPTVRDLAFLSDDVYNDVSGIGTDDQNNPVPAPIPEHFKPVTGEELTNLTGLTDADLAGVDPETGISSGYFGRLYLDTKHNTYIYANRGTEEIKDDGSTDFLHAIGYHTDQYSQALDIAETLDGKLNGNVVFTGHSLGGGLASAQALHTEQQAATFNAAGLHNRFIRNNDLNMENADKIKAYYVDNEILSEAQDNNILDATLGPIATGINGIIEVVKFGLGDDDDVNLDFIYIPEAVGERISLTSVDKEGEPINPIVSLELHKMENVINSLNYEIANS
jgi:peptidoglycan hydrolase-like protein with peptidoglycan-binding domain